MRRVSSERRRARSSFRRSPGKRWPIKTNMFIFLNNINRVFEAKYNDLAAVAAVKLPFCCFCRLQLSLVMTGLCASTIFKLVVCVCDTTSALIELISRLYITFPNTPPRIPVLMGLTQITRPVIF